MLNAIPLVTYSFHNAEKVDGTVSVRAEKVVLVPSQSVEGGKPQVSMGNKEHRNVVSTRIHECYRNWKDSPLPRRKYEHCYHNSHTRSIEGEENAVSSSPEAVGLDGMRRY